MRGELSIEELQKIENKLPQFDFKGFYTTVDQFHDSAKVYDLETKTSLYHISAICLSDAGHRFSQIRMGLHESYACLEYYTKYVKQSNSDMVGIYTAKFYADYVTLIFYAIGEDIAEFIKHFLNIKSTDFNDPVIEKALQSSNVSSQQGKVGIYLKNKLPTHEITKIIAKLYCQEWKKVIDYRNTWVHDKPPIIDGLGIQHNRENKIKQHEDGSYSVGFGGGDRHDYTIEELQTMIKDASCIVSGVLSDLIIIIEDKEKELIQNSPILRYRSSSK